MNVSYDQKFYKQIAEGSEKSANIVVPLVCDMVKPNSILELGCGVATWSSAFEKNGVSDITAIDGPWVDTASLKISADKFMPHDLRQPLAIERKFDLAICMEVAEHLPEDMAQIIVDLLTENADTILFAAAIPFQGGTDHINEKPQSYWAAMFKERGYICYDAIRPAIWENNDIEFWYRQNTLIFSKNPLNVEQNPILDIVHPEMLLYYAEGWKGVLRASKKLLLRKT